MTCDEAQHLLNAQLDNELPHTDAARLQSHLAQCDACRAAPQALITLHTRLRDSFAPRQQTASTIATKVLAQLSEGEAPSEPFLPSHREGEAPPEPSSSPGNAEFHPKPLNRNSTTSPQKSTWWKLPLAAAAGFLIATLLFQPWRNPQQLATTLSTQHSALSTDPPIANLSVATGQIFICPANTTTWHPLETGGPVSPGDKIKTGPNIRCEFKLADGSEVRLNSQTQITLHSPRNIQVAQGQIFSSVFKAPNSSTEPFIVRADPVATSFTALGTQFDVNCSSDTAQPTATLTVVEGAVNAKDANSENTIKAGESLQIADGRFGDKQAVQSLVQATQWVDEILVLKGRDNPELARRINDLLARLGREKMSYMYAQEVRRLGDHCVLPLSRYIQSDLSKSNQEQFKRHEAARIIADVATPACIPELINLLADEDGEIRYNAAKALNRLTANPQSPSPEFWRDQPQPQTLPALTQWHTWWQTNNTKIPGADPSALKPLETVKSHPSPTQKG